MGDVMGDLVAAYVTLGVGVVLLVLVMLRVLRPVRRFTHANAAVRADLARRTTSIRELMTTRRRGENDST
jgi:hypothetical protein